MSYIFVAIVAIFFAFYLGWVAAGYYRVNESKRDKEHPVIGIYSGVIHDEQKIKDYQKVAIPLAEKAGLRVLGHSEVPEVIEGAWPYSGFIVIEQFASRKAWQEYRESEAYQEAKRIRDTALKMDFVVAIDGYVNEIKQED